MNKFISLDKREVSLVEKDIREKWLKDNILEKTINNRKDAPYFVFYDGPAFANGFPGLHHMVAKNLKDIICKYKTMQGYKVLRKIGWDTHGLPIENHVEKKLGFKTKKDIEDFGIDNFNCECRKSVCENEAAFTDLTHKMGQFIDTENPYLTYKNEYIETEWWILKKIYEAGLFYEGTKVTPYCPRCGTVLASHEVAQGYKNVEVTTVTVPFKVKDKDEYFLVWTTTPWTLMANVGLCVNPNETYVKALSCGYKFILAKKLMKDILGDKAEILEEYKGHDLENIEYEQLLPFIKVKDKAFYVCSDDYVTMEEGTGIVHLAPAFGEDDARVGKKWHLPYINPVGKDGTYNEGPWKGILVFDADKEVIKYLKENDKLFKSQKVSHDYPYCWRCDSPLLYYTMPSYYIEVSKFKDKLVKANSQINWYPSYVGEKRFKNWLENAKDWAISRTRYWGSPIPFYKCECGYQEMIGSIQELKEKAIEKVDEKTLDLHKPYIDNIHLKCPKCGKKMTRIVDVLDCWFDSGSMPFSQYHYPFENQELFNLQFPADFICEGIDQTRGWFYTLLIISTFLKGISPFKNVLVNDLLLDAEGKKMSKSRGNIVEPFKTMEQYGADTVRFYLPYVSPVWTPLKFNEEGLKEVFSKFFNPLRNTYNFFSMYANIDKIDLKECQIDIKDREEIDRWLISKYNSLLKYVVSSFEEYDLNKVVKALTNFVSEDLSNWYIRRCRNRFWGNKLDNSKKSVYITTYEVLVGLSKIMAPIIPYLSEEMYTKLTKEYSVHLADYPKYDEKLINKKLEEKMELVKNLISMGRMIREEVKIKVRTPLKRAIIDSKVYSKIENLVPLIKEELNVKELVKETNLNKYMNIEVKPNYKIVGKLFGSKIKDYEKFLQDVKINELEKEILEFANTKITNDMYELKITSKEGFNVYVVDNLFIVLDTQLNTDLINEGHAREFISKIQNLRKEKGYEISDRINIYYQSKEFEDVIKEYDDYIKKETLAKNIIKKDLNEELLVINGIKVFIEIEKYSL